MMSPNSIFNEYLGENVKDFYTNKKYSDVAVRITEEVEAADPDVQSSSSTDVRSKVVRCHKLLLHINSPYFEDVLEKQEEEADELEVKVNEGEMRYMEILLPFFYDEDVIKNLNLIDLICLLEVSVTYARGHHQKAIVDLIEKLEPDFDSAIFGLQKLYSIDKGSVSNISEELRSSLKQKFSAYLAKFFAPIEENQEKHELFLGLEYSLLLYLLQGNEPIAMTENSLLELVSEWLDFDTSRQTPDNIEGLLTNIRVKHTGGKVLHEGIGLQHRIFNKWDGYKEWLWDALGFLSFSPEEQSRIPSLNEVSCRNILDGTYTWFKNKVNQNLNAIRWKVHMATVEKGKKLEPTRHLLVHDGMKFSPKSIIISPVEGDDTTFNMSLEITSSYSMFGVRFVVGIVPANNEYDISTKYFHSPFARSFLKWTDPVDVETSSLDIDFWTISGDLVKISDEYGLYVFLLPLTDDEYKVLKGYRFAPKCNWCHYDFFYGNQDCDSYSTVVGANTCSRGHHTQHGTFSGAEISLQTASNFSV